MNYTDKLVEAYDKNKFVIEYISGLDYIRRNYLCG